MNSLLKAKLAQGQWPVTLGPIPDPKETNLKISPLHLVLAKTLLLEGGSVFHLV